MMSPRLTLQQIGFVEFKPLILSEDFIACLNELEGSNEHYYLTGRAGTGKSTLLQLFRKTTAKKVIVLAPTGVAALHVQGQTIHSFFRFPPRILDISDIRPVKNPKFFNSIDTIVIDEISMVRADVLDNIDYALRLNRQDDRLFGGVQMIFIGDLFQLPPVVSGREEMNYFHTTYASPYFFSARVFQKGFSLTMIELMEVYRQDERRFISLLESIRLADIDADLLFEINDRVEHEKQEDQHYITLCSRNASARKINQEALDKIDKPTYMFPAKVQGQFAVTLYPTDEVLVLKEDAQVMFVRNDPTKRFVNGTIGTIVELASDRIVVSIKDETSTRIVEVEAIDWEILRYNQHVIAGDISSQVIGSFTQYPLRLAWAITIHKSQGKTFDFVEIDLAGGAFEHGQTYVALSRCRSLDGIVLKSPIQYRDIMVDERVIDFHRELIR